MPMTVSNIGAEGLCFLAAASLKSGQNVTVYLPLKDREEIVLQMSVVWSWKVSGSEEYQSGLKIIDSGREDGQRFIRFYCEAALFSLDTEKKQADENYS